MSDVLHVIIDQAGIAPDHPAVKDLEAELSYSELIDEVARIAAGLRIHGVSEGDRAWRCCFPTRSTSWSSPWRACGWVRSLRAVGDERIQTLD